MGPSLGGAGDGFSPSFWLHGFNQWNGMEDYEVPREEYIDVVEEE